MNNLNSKTEEELEELLQHNILEIQDLHILVNKKHKLILDIRNELQSRDPWSAAKIIDDMIEQLSEYKQEISSLSFNALERSLLNVVSTKDLNMSQNRRTYRKGKILKYLYFDLERPIIQKLLSYKLIEKNLYGVAPKFQIKFDFNDSKRTITRRHSYNIFSAGKNKCYEFKIDNAEFVNLNKQILSLTKKSYFSYNEIIPDMIKVVKFIENELDAVLLLHYLAER